MKKKFILIFVLLFVISCNENAIYNIGKADIPLNSINIINIYYINWSTSSFIGLSKQNVRENSSIKAVLKSKRQIRKLLENLNFEGKNIKNAGIKDHRVVIDIILDNEETITVGMTWGYYYVNGYIYKNTPELKDFITNLVEDHMTWIDPVFEKMRKSK